MRWMRRKIDQGRMEMLGVVRSGVSRFRMLLELACAVRSSVGVLGVLRY